MSSNIFQRLPEIFFDIKPEDGKDYIKILGRDSNRRIYKYVRRDYVNNPLSLDSYKVFVAQANGCGAFGETLSTPVIAEAGVGATETFISIGKLKSKEEANALRKYIMSKFARAMLSVLKVTQMVIKMYGVLFRYKISQNTPTLIGRTRFLKSISSCMLSMDFRRRRSPLLRKM